MRDMALLYKNREVEEGSMLLAKASALAKKIKNLSHTDLQDELKVGYAEAALILDWLADNHEIEVKISEHYVRCGRAYVLNNPFASLKNMAELLNIGDRRAFQLMMVLEERGIIRIKDDFTFEQKIRLASFESLVRQMKRVAKKYRGRCEPQLLLRTLYVDPITAFRLAQYGEEYLSLRWKNRPKELM